MYVSNTFGTISLGADPEIFVVNKDGTPWGAIHTGITGTKENPQVVPKGAVQIDGLALEFNIDPAFSLEEWETNLATVAVNITKTAQKKGYKTVQASMLDFTQYIDTAKPTEDELLFGCDPDFNADTMQENTMPDNDGSIKFRTTGGHVHIGMTNWQALCMDDDRIAHAMAQQIIFVCDGVLGLWSVLNDDGLERKKLYGKAGAYRIKPYGVEYRTMSNFWIFDPELRADVFTTVTHFMADSDNWQRAVSIATAYRNEIVEAINTNDRDAAAHLLAKFY